MKKLFIALAVVLGLASCKIDRDLSFVVQEMMNVRSGLLVNDAGVKYSIQDQQTAGEILSQQRLFITGTAEPSEVSGYDYKLTPYEWYGVILQDCVTLSSVEDVDGALGTSPVELSHVWFDGGYVNALTTVSFDLDTEDETEFNINLVFDDERSTSNELYFILKNKQIGKTWEDEDLSSEKVVFGSQFMSFPFEQYIDSGFHGELTIHVEWVWFDSSPVEGELPYKTVSAKQGNYTYTVK